MGRRKRLTAEEIGSIKYLRQEGYSNREIARRIDRSAKVVNNFVQDIKNYGKNYRGGIQTATTVRERRTILREAPNFTMLPEKLKMQ
jgi:transposase